MSRKLHDCDFIKTNLFDTYGISAYWIDLRWLNYFDDSKDFSSAGNWAGQIIIGDSEDYIKQLKGEIE